MNGLPYYKAYPRDFIEGTIGMPFELKAAYRLVLDLIYMQGGELPDDARYISGLLGCTVRKWNSFRNDLIAMGKIVAEDGYIHAPIIDDWARMGARPAIPVATQREVWARDGAHCVYCADSSGPFHLDHVIPWSRGGQHTADNLVVACSSCNLSKGDKTPTEWGGYN